jgi:ribosomal protein S18 acetylase RimI-like enzyme
VDAATLGGGSTGGAHRLTDDESAEQMLAEPARCVPDPDAVSGANGYGTDGLLDSGLRVGDWLGHRRSVRKWIVNPDTPTMTPSDIKLRPAADGDAEAVTLLVGAAYEHYIERIGRKPMPMTLDYGEEIRQKAVTVAEEGEKVVGVLVLDTTDEGFLIYNVAVHPTQRGTGVGRALLEFAEAEARRAGFDSVYLFTHEKMTENQELYARIGYVEYDRRQIEDLHVVFMRKQLA